MRRYPFCQDKRLYAAVLPAAFLIVFFAVVFFISNVPASNTAATAFLTAVRDTADFLLAVFNTMVDIL